jgi:hypothetical protein
MMVSGSCIDCHFIIGEMEYCPISIFLCSRDINTDAESGTNRIRGDGIIKELFNFI